VQTKKIIKLTKVATLLTITVFCGYFGQRMLQETIYRHYETANNGRNACISNLRQIEGAKALVAFEMRLKPGDLLSSQALIPYMIGVGEIAPQVERTQLTRWVRNHNAVSPAMP
jgi:hypothetical protein